MVLFQYMLTVKTRFCQKDANGIANSEDLNQTAPRGAVCLNQTAPLGAV